MARTVCEEALSRTLHYLARAGVEPTDEVMLAALALVEDTIADSGGSASIQPNEVLQAVMRELPRRFRLPEPALPSLSPRLERGSIGYEEYR